MFAAINVERVMLDTVAEVYVDHRMSACYGYPISAEIGGCLKFSL